MKPSISLMPYLFLLFLLPPWKAISLSVYNDLSSMYEDPTEAEENAADLSERRWHLLESIQSLASLVIRNLTQICPLNQREHLEFVDKIMKSTLASIYEKEETLARILFYERVLPTITKTFDTCLQSPTSRITIQEFFSQEYPETILHLDLMKNPDESSKWYDFRRCIRTRDSSQFFPGLIPSVIDTFWNSFLVGYFGCMEYWVTLDAWSFMDAVHSTILFPVYTRWKSKFPGLPLESNTTTNSSRNSSSGSSLPDDVSENDYPKINYTSVEYMLKSLEKCNVILFMKNPSDPIPCFKDAMEEFED